MEPYAIQPTGCLPDELIFSALKRTHLWMRFEPRPSTSQIQEQRLEALDRPLSSFPQMSAGELQLFALTRAIIRLQCLNNLQSPSNFSPHGGTAKPIILLDKATSSVDGSNESIMRGIIEQEFLAKGLTVIAITHRVSALADSLQSQKTSIALFSEGKLKQIREARDFSMMDQRLYKER
jgi:ABC-type multidrug transport system fused ATPase/permease subunit